MHTFLRAACLIGLLASPGVAAAQEFGIRSGLTLANVNVTEPRRLPAELQWCCSPWDGTRHDMAIGLFAGLPVQPGVAVMTEVLLTRRGFTIGDGPTWPGASLRMTYLEVPVLLQYVGGLVRISAGASAGFALSTSQWSDDVGRTTDFIDRAGIAGVDASIVVGASLHRRRFSLDGRYVHGLRNVLTKAPDGASLRHKSLMLLVGVRLAGPGCPCEPPPPPPKWPWER